jgi:hypothetical protein
MPQIFHDELVQEFYGLDSENMSVDSVSITKSGKMHRWTERDGYISAQLSAPDMQAEVTRHFRLIHLVAVEPNASVELRQQVIRGLKATARLLNDWRGPNYQIRLPCSTFDRPIPTITWCLRTVKQLADQALEWTHAADLVMVRQRAAAWSALWQC